MHMNSRPLSCPMCRVTSVISLENTIFGTGDCAVCMENRPFVIFQECHHATVCVECVRRMCEFT